MRRRGRRLRSRSQPLAAALCAVACAACSSSTPTRTAADTQIFAAGSPFNTTVPAHPEVASDSARLVRLLVGNGSPVANLYTFGTPVFEAGADTPRRTVRCTDDTLPCDLARASVPFPANAKPASGADGAMVIVDLAARTSYEFYRAARQPDGNWTAASTSRVNLDGDGRHGQTGAGISLLAGLIRTSDIESGEINHAVEFASSYTCRDTFVYPAVKTDGVRSAPDCLPMGTRLQLDPAIDVDSLPGLSRAERAIARALQRYGGYIRNSAGTALALGFESPSGESDPYPAAGLEYDYNELSGIPWSHLRVVTGS